MVEAHAIKERLRHWKWRWIANTRDTVSEIISPSELGKQERDIVRAVRMRGIATTVGFADRGLFEELRADAYRLRHEVWDQKNRKMCDVFKDRKADRTELGAEESKEFLRILTPKRLSSKSTYIRYALQPQFVSIANVYLGLKARLRAVHLWLNYPTMDAPSSTQLWHRDNDDYKSLKVFTNLTDVTMSSGPFGYIPGTHRHGPLCESAMKSYTGRLTDEKATEILPKCEWLFCTGAAGSLVFADTSGLHKGLKPDRDHRLMLMLHFTSRSADSELKVEWLGESALTRHQIRALV